jgi:hypothetical protein
MPAWRTSWRIASRCCRRAADGRILPNPPSAIQSNAVRYSFVGHLRLVCMTEAIKTAPSVTR